MGAPPTLHAPKHARTPTRPCCCPTQESVATVGSGAKPELIYDYYG